MVPDKETINFTYYFINNNPCKSQAKLMIPVPQIRKQVQKN